MEGLEPVEFTKIPFLNGYVHKEILIYTWIIIVILVFISYLFMRKKNIIPAKIQGMFEVIYFYLSGLAEDMMGEEGKKYVPFVMTIFLFVLSSNWIGLIPNVKTPTIDINTTLALAVISFLSFNYFGIKKAYETTTKEGNRPKNILQTPTYIILGFWKWFSHFFQPIPELWKSLEGALKYILVPLLVPLFFVLNVTEEIIRILSLSVRLVGNIMGEHLAVFFIVGLFIAGWQLDFITFFTKPILWASSAFILIIGALAGFIQALIFTVLTLSYISRAVADEH